MSYVRLAVRGRERIRRQDGRQTRLVDAHVTSQAKRTAVVALLEKRTAIGASSEKWELAT